MVGMKNNFFYAFPPQKTVIHRLTVVPTIAIDQAWSN